MAWVENAGPDNLGKNSRGGKGKTRQIRNEEQEWNTRALTMRDAIVGVDNAWPDNLGTKRLDGH